MESPVRSRQFRGGMHRSADERTQREDAGLGLSLSLPEGALKQPAYRNFVINNQDTTPAVRLHPCTSRADPAQHARPRSFVGTECTVGTLIQVGPKGLAGPAAGLYNRSTYLCSEG
jgi:hypothetical protein